MTRSIARHLCDGRATCQNYIAPKIDFIWLYMKLLSLKICMSICIAGFPACVCLKPDADVNCEVLCCFFTDGPVWFARHSSCTAVWYLHDHPL